MPGEHEGYAPYVKVNDESFPLGAIYRPAPESVPGFMAGMSVSRPMTDWLSLIPMRASWLNRIDSIGDDLGNCIKPNCVAVAAARLIEVWLGNNNPPSQDFVDDLFATWGGTYRGIFTDEAFKRFSGEGVTYRARGEKGAGQYRAMPTWSIIEYDGLMPDLKLIRAAIYYLGGVLAVFDMPEILPDDNWTAKVGARETLNNHCVPLVGYDETYIYGISWGRVVKISNGFVESRLKQASAFCSTLWTRRAPDGRMVTPSGLSYTELTNIGVHVQGV